MKNTKKENQTFEEIKHIDENGVEYWYARELQKILEYTQWRRFENVIDKAKISCENTGINAIDHFADVGKMVQIGSGAETEGEACKTHNKIGKIVRNAIKQAGGTMPENLPTPEKSLKQLEKENKKMLKK